MEQPGCALWPSHALSWGRQSEQRAPQSSQQRQATQQPPTSPELLRSHSHSPNSGRAVQGDFTLSPAPVKTGAWFVHSRTDCRSSTIVLLVFTSSHDQTHKPSQGFYSSYTSSPKQRTSLLPAPAFPPQTRALPAPLSGRRPHAALPELTAAGGSSQLPEQSPGRKAHKPALTTEAREKLAFTRGQGPLPSRVTQEELLELPPFAQRRQSGAATESTSNTT